MRRILPLLLAALAAVLLAQPASAASLQWQDPEGDAHLHVNAALPPVPTPNEPALDVRRVRIEASGENIVWSADVAKLGASNPNGSTGISFTWAFKYGAGEYSLTVIDDAVYGKATEMRGGTTGSLAPLTCGKCIGLMDRKGSKVTITTPVSSLSRAIRGVDAAAKALAPGAKFESLSLSSVRNYGFGNPAVVAGRFNIVSDRTAPPADAAFTL